MDVKRFILYAALAFVLYSLWMKWQEDYPPTHPSSPTLIKTPTNQALLPELNIGDGKAPPVETLSKNLPISQNPIQVKTDLLFLKIDPAQGDIVEAQLLDYPVSVDEKNTPFTLLYQKPESQYTANSSIFSVDNGIINTLNFNFTSEKQGYQMAANDKQLVVSLLGKSDQGLVVKKNFKFTRGSYVIDVDYELDNQGDKDWKGYVNSQLYRASPEEGSSSLFQVSSYTGASVFNPEKHRYQKVSFSEMQKSNLKLEGEETWVAMQEHYFLSAWIPQATAKTLLYTRADKANYTIGMVSQPIDLKASAKQSIENRLYLGPENTEILKSIAPGLELTIDYGWLWFLSSTLFALMKSIHSVIGNWGWSIVLVTLIIKLVFYRLSATSYKSMAGMRKLQPKLQALKERYGDDKTKISQATMELYRQEKVNPLGGCLPIIIQIPVFIALYWVLLESVELRQAPFIFWVKDLATADPYHVLPLIMGFTMFLQQRLNPAPPDPTQAKVMMFLPVLFTGLFWSFPAGLVLYWIVNNTLSILQQWYITRKYADTK